MTLLLCPECCQWREPVEGRCPVCAGTLDIAVPDPSLETIADEIGDLQGLLGEAAVSRAVLPQRGRLYATANGLLFIPLESCVIEFVDSLRVNIVPQRNGFIRLFSQLWSRLSGRTPVRRFACERRPNALIASHRLALAGLLRSDPGLLFMARELIAGWNRQRGRWEFIHPEARRWPETLSMRSRDGDRALQTWLETTFQQWRESRQRIWESPSVD